MLFKVGDALLVDKQATANRDFIPTRLLMHDRACNAPLIVVNHKEEKSFLKGYSRYLILVKCTKACSAMDFAYHDEEYFYEERFAKMEVIWLKNTYYEMV